MRGPLWLNGLGVLFALAAVCADFLHFNPNVTLIAALGAVLSFAVSGIIVLRSLRNHR
jgi:hypothetical protein